jgi:hypothetical protein
VSPIRGIIANRLSSTIDAEAFAGRQACTADSERERSRCATHERSLAYERAFHNEHVEPALVFTELCDWPYEPIQRYQIGGLTSGPSGKYCRKWFRIKGHGGDGGCSKLRPPSSVTVHKPLNNLTQTGKICPLLSAAIRPHDWPELGRILGPKSAPDACGQGFESRRDSNSATTKTCPQSPVDVLLFVHIFLWDAQEMPLRLGLEYLTSEHEHR